MAFMPLRAVVAGIGLSWVVLGASVLFTRLFNPPPLGAIEMGARVLVLLMCCVPTGVVLLVGIVARRLMVFV